MLTIKQTAVRESIFGGVANMVLGSIATYIALPNQNVLALLGGPESAGFGFFPASIFFPLAVTLLITRGVKKRVARGEVESSGSAALGWMPKNTLLASLIISSVAVLVLAPLSLGFIWLLFGSSLSYATAFGVNVAYMILLACLLIPVIVYRAGSL